MPSQIDVSTRSGVVKFSYTISTPYSSDAERIVPGLPTVLFVHPVCTTQMIFHSQFADPNLRRFNLVSFGLREHSETIGPKVPPTYDAEEAAREMASFMDALYLPSCHIYAMALGTAIALQFGISYPEKTLSLFLVSQLCLAELPAVAEGHTQIYELWKSAHPDPSTVKEDVLKDSLFGNMQYAFTNKLSDLAGAMVKYMYPILQRQWDYGNLDVCKTMVLDVITFRKGHTRDELAKIQCPVKVVYGTSDVAYTLEHTETFVQDLRDAGVADVSLIIVRDAPHFVCVDYGHVVNPILHDLVVAIAGESSLPPIPKEATSPWDQLLKEAGWGESDDDDLIYYYERSLRRQSSRI